MAIAEREAEILVVDDNPQNIALVQAQLERAGYRVSCARGGQDGLEAAASSLPDLILLDIMMPGLDGYEVCRRLRENSATRMIPVIMLTSLHERADKLRALETGADDFLSKPVDRAELLARVRSLLRMKRVYDDLARSKRETELQALQLATEKSRIEAILSSMSDGVLMTDPEGRITFLNPAVQTLTGITLEDALGRPWHEALAVRTSVGRPLDADTCPIAEAMTQNAPVGDRELSIWRADGREITISVAAAPIAGAHAANDSGVAVLRDVTSQREIQRMKEDFVGLVSHELRTPLAAIYGFAELLLQRERLSDTGRTYVETMYKEAERMTNLVNDFLDVERFASGRMSFHFRAVQLDQVVAEAREDLASQLTNHSIVVDTSSEPVYVRADKDRLVQILLNLLSNAIKYSPNGGEIRVRAKVERQHAVISVSDHGLGLPSGSIGKLFEKFYRVEASSHRNVSGTGLGLAICKQIAESMSGHIWAESPGIGLGSTFSFTLPLAGVPIARPAEPTMANGRGRILLVKDDPSLAAIILEQLGPLGYAVEAVSSGEDAISHVRADKPSAVVLDVGPAGHPDGWGVLAALREDPATTEIPVIVISGRDGQEHGQVLGVDDFLVKPVPSNRLVGTVRRLAGTDGGGPIVVADDDAVNRQVVQEILSRAGFEVTAVPDGETAIEAIEAHPPLALVLDLMMPGLDGLGVLERLRADERFHDLPVLVLTARDLSDEERDLLRRRTSEVLGRTGGVGPDIADALRRAMGISPASGDTYSPRKGIRLVAAAQSVA